ncbi:hypothetical protein BKA82DRAFT_4015550 [Pisolithus tinctorius]|nr:hypothetical protein BKA82DRAFT_4015550 [Pisolithus tinctorius]
MDGDEVYDKLERSGDVWSLSRRPGVNERIVKENGHYGQYSSFYLLSVNMLYPSHINGLGDGRFKKSMPPTRVGASPCMIVPEKPVTFFVDIPPRPGVTLERDDVPIFRQLFPVRRQRSKLHLNPPSVARQVASFVFGFSHTNPRRRSYITSVAHRRLGRSDSSKYLVDKHSNTRAMDAELKNQLPVSLRHQSSRLDPAKAHSTKPKRVCHPAHTPTPVVAVEHVAPTTLSQDPPAVTSSEKPSESMAFDNSRAEIHPPSSRSSQPINLVSPSAPPAGIDHIQPPEGERGLSRIPIPATATTAAVVNWPLKRTQKAIRKQKEYVTFYRSFSEGPLDSPPDVPEAYEHPWRIADLYVHHNQTEGAFQVWIRSETGWIKAAVDTHHPTLSDYRLKLLDNGEPSWVLRKTMVTDRGRAKRKQEALTIMKPDM